MTVDERFDELLVARVSGRDPDAMTQSEFDDYRTLAPQMLRWEKGEDIAGELGRRVLDWQSLLMVAFGGGGAAERAGDEDELSG